MNEVDREKFDRNRLDIKSIGEKVRRALQRSGMPEQSATDVVDRLNILYRLGLEDEDILLPIAYPQICALAGLLANGFESVLPTCLDYSYVTNFDGRKRYTFEGVGAGVSANAFTLLEKAPALYRGIAEVGFRLSNGVMLVSDVEATDGVYQSVTGLDEGQIRENAGLSRDAIGFVASMAVGLMSEYVSDDDIDFGKRQAGKIGESAKVAIGFKRPLYQTLFHRCILVGEIQNTGHPFQYHQFMVDRVEADLQRYIALGAACRRRGIAIVDATAPEITTYYNVGADEYPVTPYIRIVDEYE